MQELELKSAEKSLLGLGIQTTASAKWNLTPAELVEQALFNKEAVLTDTGALMADTGAFTGRSPKDRFIVKDSNTAESVWWGDINIAFDEVKFDNLYSKNGIIHTTYEF